MSIDCISLNQLQSLIPCKEEDLPNLRTLLYNHSMLFLNNFGFDGNIADPSVSGRTFQLPCPPTRRTLDSMKKIVIYIHHKPVSTAKL